MAISKQDVFNAAAAIEAQGGKPTLNAIRQALAGGSFSTISEAMAEWRSLQKAAVAVGSSVVREPAPEAISNRLNELADDVWEIALQLANRRLQGEREALAQSRNEMALVQQETAELVDALSADLESALNQLKQQTETNATSALEVDSLHRDVATLNDSLRLAHQETQLANVALSEVRQQTEQLAAMLDSEKAERINASKKLEQSLVTIAELNANVTELAADLNVMTDRAKAAEAKSNQTDQALNDATKRLDKAANEIQSWQNKAALADAQISAFKEQTAELKVDTKQAIEQAAEMRGKLTAAQERIAALENQS